MKLSDYRGRVVLLNFGCHETCAPCRAMYPYEKSLVKRSAGSLSPCSDSTSMRNEQARTGNEGRADYLALLVGKGDGSSS